VRRNLKLRLRRITIGDYAVSAFRAGGTLADAVDRGIGQLEVVELPHRFGYLLSLVGTA
jgi:hypothetical protein